MEAAIVMPLFVFVILGTLQLGLLHQARLLTKYAAYKAARTGALYNARVEKMEEISRAVLLPLISTGSHGGEVIRPVASPIAYGMKWNNPFILKNLMPDVPGLKYTKVTICGPTTDDLGQTQGEIDFDDQNAADPNDWKTSENTKLRVQVQFNYRMPIPFANWVINRIMRGQDQAQSLRLGLKGNVGSQPQVGGLGAEDKALITLAAQQQVYIVPLRASYTMRMQSNVFIEKAPLPKTNECVIHFEKQ